MDDAVAAVNQAKEAALSVLGTLPDADAVASALEEVRAKIDLGDVDVDAALASLRESSTRFPSTHFPSTPPTSLDIDPTAAWRMEDVAAAAGDEPALAGAVPAAVAHLVLRVAIAAVARRRRRVDEILALRRRPTTGSRTSTMIPAMREYWSERPFSGAGDDEAPPRSAGDLISEQGPAFVKVGQAIAIRPDLLPQAYLDELQKLLDQVAPFGSDEARVTDRGELGRRGDARRRLRGRHDRVRATGRRRFHRAGVQGRR